MVICSSRQKKKAYAAEKEANSARQQAQAAREAAETVLNFLVFELQDKLTPLGRLDIVEMAQQQVNDYYRQLGIEGQSAEVLNQPAVSYGKEGDRLFAQGKLEKAREAYQQAFSLMERISMLESDNLLGRAKQSVGVAGENRRCIERARQAGGSAENLSGESCDQAETGCA